MFSLANLIVLATALPVAAYLVLSPTLRHSETWRAIITPLASIMGSGFLVCAPLLYNNVGNAALYAMAGLLFLAFIVGSVIRFNIRYAEPLFKDSKNNQNGSKADKSGQNGNKNHLMHKVMRLFSGQRSESHSLYLTEKLSHIVLACAYTISVSYYLQLLAHFSLHHLSVDTHALEDIIVTVILIAIGIIGTLRGLKGIESVENVIVSLNLALIAALIAGLVYFNITSYWNGSWQLAAINLPNDQSHTIRLLMGLLIIVQGFETSRFLGSEHSAETRIRTMRTAQLLSAGIYLAFISLMAAVIGKAGIGNTDGGVTAIITLSAFIAPLLPLMITLTAIGSQLSAATADDAGCSGLLQGFIRRVKGFKIEYAIVSVLSITLTWLTDIYEIISIASRAFALYYMLQAAVAFIVTYQNQNKNIKHLNLYRALFIFIGLICAAIAIFGIPAG